MLILVFATCTLYTAEAAKILAVFPTPSISHQVPFRSITQEFANRGHEIVIITTDPAFEKGKTPPNLREIDLHDMSYEIWRTKFTTLSMGKKEDLKAIRSSKKTTAQKINNCSMWDKINELYSYWYLDSHYRSREMIENQELRRFAPNMPDLSELNKNIDMMFLNMHPLWDGNRPVPPNVIYMNGIHQKPLKKLPVDLETYLNASRNGVVYVSFGTNVVASKLPNDTIQTLIKVFSQMPYDFLWKWEKDELMGRTKNIKIFKWLPQSDLLRHPKIKLFITQCGLQSTDESIAAGVPLLGIPMLGDQWYNAEKYEHLGIGLRIDMETMNEEGLKKAINSIANDDSYRQNIVKLRSLMSDQPQSALDRVVWWTEHVLRHGGGHHFRAPGASISWRQYLELDLLFIVLTLTFLFILSVITVVYYAVKNIQFTKVKLS